MKEPKILILMGSASDLPQFEDTQKIFDNFDIPFDLQILSAHRSPKLVIKKIEHLAKSVEVIIAGAGGAAHLAGVVAAHTLRPVIGVPMNSSLLGFDSLVSTSQMPAGIPVATMAIGKAGATNAALLAVQILALHDQQLEASLVKYRQSLIDKIEKANQEIQKNRK